MVDAFLTLTKRIWKADEIWRNFASGSDAVPNLIEDQKIRSSPQFDTILGWNLEFIHADSHYLSNHPDAYSR